MPRRTLAFVLFAVVISAVCVRLGLWQLERRDVRRAYNAEIRAPLGAPASPYDAQRHGVAAGRFLRVTLSGVADYANEVVHASRTRDGSPGVNLLTPLRLVGRDTVVLVNRGWVYAPDGMSVDRARWREGDTLTVTGFVDTFAAPATGSAQMGRRNGAPLLRRLDLAAVRAAIPHPVGGTVIVATAVRPQPPRTGDHPVRLVPPTLDEGPHLGYAIQWFAFAAIGLVGVLAIGLRARASG